jgi:hypothetical protein
MRESCKSCKEKERRKEWKERGRYWRGLEWCRWGINRWFANAFY